jgi:redox-sensitive bicupin YhaK (pirin superfamily)
MVTHMSELLRIQGRVSEVADGLIVHRVLPATPKRSVGPFVFFDHMGPVNLQPDTDSDVGGHPHIGLATVSYLFEGSLLHRDSIGSEQLISPGAVNWMIAGRGIVHSERVTDSERGKSRRLHGLQLWVALPPSLEEIEPSFQHVGAADIPEYKAPGGALVRVLVGQAFGYRSPVNATSPTLYLDVQLPAHAEWSVPTLAAEMALYSPEHAVFVDGQVVPAQEMVVLPQYTSTVVRAGVKSVRFVVIGGAPLEQPVRMWWNFVSTDRQRIAAAAKRWEAGEFENIPGEIQRISAPKWVD